MDRASIQRSGFALAVGASCCLFTAAVFAHTTQEAARVASGNASAAATIGLAAVADASAAGRLAPVREDAMVLPAIVGDARAVTSGDGDGGVQPPPGQPRPLQTPQPGAPGPAIQPPPQPPFGQPTPQGPRGEGARPRDPGQLLNVRVEVTITEQQGGKTMPPKVMALTLADRESGSIRTRVAAAGGMNPELNVDARPFIEGDGKLRLTMSLAFDLEELVEKDRKVTTIRESLTLVLDNNKPMLVSQSADPNTDRKVSVEVKATILK